MRPASHTLSSVAYAKRSRRQHDVEKIRVEIVCVYPIRPRSPDACSSLQPLEVKSKDTLLIAEELLFFLLHPPLLHPIQKA